MLIKLVGLISIEGDRTPLRYLSSAQAQVAFARLTLERASGTGRDQLADTVWPNGLPDTWASALRSVVSRVRAFASVPDIPESDVLVARGGRYLLRLPPDAVVDLELAQEAVGLAGDAFAAGNYAEALRHAVAAVSTLRQPFLPDHEGEWVRTVRERVHELLLAELETASLSASALGDDRNALDFANEAVKRSPLRESAYRCLMRAYSAAGNRAEALAVYHRLRRTLADELGIDPAAETQAMYIDILGGPARPSGQPARAKRDLAAGVQFTGRRTELAILTEAWTRASAGAGGIVLLTGEAGIGKTRLAVEAARRVDAAGGMVLFGRPDHGTTVPYQPVVRAVADFVRALPEVSSPALRQAGKTLAALTADLERRPEAAGRPDDPELLVLLGNLLADIAREQPTYVVLDDVDLADETLTLLRHVFRRHPDDLPLLVIATTRNTARGRAGFAATVQDLSREGFLQRIHVRGLEESEVRALARQVLPDAAPCEVPAAHRLVADTAGNPYLLLELLQWYREHGVRKAHRKLPSGILEDASIRLAGLDPVARRLLHAASVAGASFELDVVAEATGIDPDEAMDALDMLVSTGMVTEVVSPERDRRHVYCYRFTHGVLRRAIYEQFSETRRRWLHSRLADAIERRHAGDLSRYSRMLAHHRVAGAAPGGDPRAVRSSWQAAAQATMSGAQRESVRLYQQALVHVPATDHELRAEALTRLGLAQLAAMESECQQNLFDGTIQALHSGRLDIAAEAALGLADTVLTWPRFRNEAAAVIEMILDKAGDESVGSPRSGDRQGRNTGRLNVLDDLSRGRLLARQVQLGKRLAPGRQVTAALDAMSEELCLLDGPGQVRSRLALAEEMNLVAEAADDVGSRIIAAHYWATAAEMMGDLVAREKALAALAAAANGDDRLAFGDALLADHAVAAAIAQGRLADAAALSGHVGTPAAEGHGITPAPGRLVRRQMVIAQWLHRDGQPYAAADYGKAERPLAAILAGDKGTPHLTVRALAIGAEPLPPDDEWLHTMGLLALGAVELRDAVTADALRSLLTPYAHLVCGVGYRSFIGPVSFHLGRLAIVTGDWDEAERHLMTALSHLSRRRARPWVALAQRDLARALDSRARTGDRQCADALRAEADWTLASMGMPVAH